jgi:hypothetical protein
LRGYGDRIWRVDDPRAAEQLLPLVYDELRKLAVQKMFISGSVGMFRVIGSHTYNQSGPYPVLVTIASGAAAVGASWAALRTEPPSPYSVAGASVVPGNSRYSYWVYFGPQPRTLVSNIGMTASCGPVTLGPVLLSGPRFSTVDSFGAVAEFGNSPAQITIRASFKLRGILYVASPIIVSLVQVTVAPPDPPAKAFVMGAPWDGGPGAGGPPVTGTMVGGQKVIYSGLRPTGIPPAPAIEGLQAMTAKAKVTLTASSANPNAVNSIVVGFIQHVTFTTRRAYYTPIKKLVSNLEGKTFIDVTGGPRGIRPNWYPFASSSVLNLPPVGAIEAKSGVPVIITSDDTPKQAAPLDYNYRNTDKIPPFPLTDPFLNGINFKLDFTLHIAAYTTEDKTRPPNQSYWQQAVAVGGWTFKASGSVVTIPTPPPFTSYWVDGQNNATPNRGPSKWQPVSAPTPEDVKGITGNEAQQGSEMWIPK